MKSSNMTQSPAAKAQHMTHLKASHDYTEAEGVAWCQRLQGMLKKKHSAKDEDSAKGNGCHQAGSRRFAARPRRGMAPKSIPWPAPEVDPATGQMPADGYGRLWALASVAGVELLKTSTGLSLAVPPSTRPEASQAIRRAFSEQYLYLRRRTA